jgi:hypothetical protein
MRQTEELFIARWLRLADGREVPVFVTKKENLAEVLFGMGLNGGNAIQPGTLEVEFHHGADRFGEAGVDRDRKIQDTDRRGKRLAVRAVQAAECAFIAAKRRALTGAAGGQAQGLARKGIGVFRKGNQTD